jgi:branched-chain amino acid transport system ATP-binding protein
MLSLENIDVFYGDAQALWGVSLTVQENEIVTLLGSNGAGKTTCLRTISGLLVPSNGAIRFRGTPIQGMRPFEIVRKGIAHVPEGRGLFPNMTVLETLTIGAFIPEAWKKRSDALERVFSLFPVLNQRCSQLAGTLSGGEQQMLAIGRGLMVQPSLLMLDEPSLGLAPIIIEQILLIIQGILAQGVAVLLIEQNANLALQISNRAYVLETGRISLTGPASDLIHNRQIQKVYLGLYEEAEWT